ncbi:MutH [Buchnera aphidicola str. Bp (Baizongia pistaciae)]|uniref:DNA mismatch repair protein MutH n=1 Tax=Buchnera aphidicola subsp. Baizongia pistaciae (strain Bp) TaxID=224915 RepID=MUTH_BUCBP|nr:DNA mismatch repair endonuclease MutH [Buchnera aphidicola]Q89B33.1 RecName: Full=DNA mismatch repair protein MutH; AltName: Full=Methyl-directed mismatch repair protein [Buchnera aphidicola str. Bp (Baizongia pistaciae)]AAO26762.1 MutH [Buchnera aphidicola str. Bp (Baizongia pistaciae)]
MCVFCEKKLFMHAIGLSGYSIREIVSSLDQPVSNSLVRNKGFVGKILELILGVNVLHGYKCIDFPSLGIELKSIPINSSGYPLEPTFICNIPLKNNSLNITWNNSYFYRKIKKILWIPIIGNRVVSFLDKIVGEAFIWTMSSVQEKILKKDWEEFMDLIIIGKVEYISSKHGQVLQVKKKCKNKHVCIKFINYNGCVKFTNPRAFYFRKSFTWSLLNLSK